MAERNFALVSTTTGILDTVIVYDPDTPEWPVPEGFVLLDMDTLPVATWVFNYATLEWEMQTALNLPVDVASGFKLEDNVIKNQASAPPLPVPYAVAMQQMRIELLKRNQLAEVEPVIQAISDSTQRQQVQIEWDFSPDVQRNDAWFTYIATELGYDDVALNKLFIMAATN